MSSFTYTIQEIFKGRQQFSHFSAQNQFLSSIAIDPDMPLDDSSQYPSGLIRPTALAKFSASAITGVPMFFVSSPKETDTYLYANDGKVHTVSSSIAMGTALNSGTALTSSSGNGAEYYDNNVYFAKNTDIAQYGQLDNSPSLTQDYWTSTLGLTALTDTTYPSINGVEMPNHVMKRHTDNKLYICDVLSGGQGALHYIKTSKTTVEGDTDDGSTHTALDFGYGWYPTDIETLGDSLLVSVIEGTNTTVSQKPARLALWNTTSNSFDYVTSDEFSDPLITAIENVNGVIYVFSGFATGGCRVSRYVGTYTLQEIAFLPDVYPPLAGATDHILNRVVWGSNTSTPETAGCVWAFGSKTGASMGIHNILRATGTGNNPWVTAVKYLQQDGNLTQPIVGWDDDTDKGLDKLSTTYGDYNVLQSERQRVGGKFQIKEIKIPLAQAVGANMTVVVKIIDSTGSATTVGTINNTNFPNSERVVKMYPKGIFYNDFTVQFEWSGSSLLTLALPIRIKGETNE